jgi:hypothetical protein
VVQFAGRHLFVNARILGDDLRVEALESDGAPIDGFTRSDCIGVRGDSTRSEVRWKERKLGALSNRPVRLRFHLASGELYSFWASADANGASQGHVAAGGPGFTGATDTTGA